MSGTYNDGTGTVHQYTLADLDLPLVQAVEGIYDLSSGVIEFPDAPFAFMLSTKEASTDIVTLTEIETVAISTRASGRLARRGNSR